MKKFRLILWMQLLMLPLIVFSSFSGCEKEDEDGFIDVPSKDDNSDFSEDSIPPQPQAGYCQIPAELLGEWDDGIVTSDKHYFVVKADSTIDGYVCYMNDSINSTKGMAVYLDKDFNATKFLFSEGVFLIERNLNDRSAYLCFIDSTGNIVMEKEVELSDETRNIVPLATRSVSDLITKSIGGFEKGYDYLGKLGTLGDFVSGDWDGVKDGLRTDLAAGAIGGIVGGLPGAIAGVLISEFFRNLQNMGNGYHDEAVKLLLGSSKAEIVSIERLGIYTYLVKVGVSNLATRPFGKVTNKQIDVKVGLYVRENFNTVNDKYKTMETEKYFITSDEVVEFTVEVDKANGIYFAAPVLMPYKTMELKGYSRYGEVEKLEGDVFDLKEIKPGNCNKNAESGDYNFNVEASASILCPDDVTSWGVDLFVWRLTASMSEVNSKKVGTIDYPLSSSAYTLKYEGQLPESFLDKDDRLFNMRAVPFAMTEKGERVEGKPKTFTVKVSGESCPDANHVHAIDLGLSVKWACHNVGASSPEGYGGYYAWGETEEKSNYTYKTYKYWSDRDGDGYDDYGEYQNIGSNISGTQYDVARVKWGGSWRMPTKDEIKELVNNCTWKWTTQNGINGQLVTGPNGNSIFLPAAGYRYGTDLDAAGSGGYYWSASPYSSSDNAYYLYFDSDYYYWYYYYNRYLGHSVRPVSE